MAAGAQVVSRGRPHGKGANVDRRRRGGAERRAAAGAVPALRRRPRRLGGAAGAAGRGGRAGRVRPRRGRLRAPGRRRLRPRARLRPLGDPPPLRRSRPRRRSPASGRCGPRSCARRCPSPRGFGMEIGMTVDAVRAGYRLARVRARPRAPGHRPHRSPASSTAARQLRDFARAYCLASLAWTGDERRANADRSAGDDRRSSSSPCRASLAQAELTARGDLFVKFSGGIAPTRCRGTRGRRSRFSVAGTVRTLSGERPPALREITIAINRGGQLDAHGLPVCRQRPDRTLLRPRKPSPAAARRWSAAAATPPTSAFPEQSAFPSHGRILAFNAVRRRPARDPRPRLRRRPGADHPHHRLPHPRHRRHLRHDPHRLPAGVDSTARAT